MASDDMLGDCPDQVENAFVEVVEGEMIQMSIFVVDANNMYLENDLCSEMGTFFP